MANKKAKMEAVEVKSEIELFDNGVGIFDGHRFVRGMLPQLIEYYLSDDYNPDDLATLVIE